MSDDGPYPGILDCQGRQNGLYPKVNLLSKSLADHLEDFLVKPL